ncbi:Bacterioferritin-associated ferredoxin [BD1-7 clade bacterium]|uniref:Bacterioferritin-associated ferredoxin n=1 Tax=BD1-7 clade bacterium TaxID=2029982 RepID=A0A5S9NVP6_9GAMM|nr:Bacterioferritin-associated ferredoxin [BD1-7 clade bacterium]CAA0094734.1 Bacterioferritin-associated ferredoxin [BD1-7 clade bacterium]
MFVCICKGITDNDIRDAVMDGATSMKMVRSKLGVSTQCGQCACMAKDIVNNALDDMSSMNNQASFYAA